MGKLMTKIGPADKGRRMSLDEFEHADVVDGHLYELSRGVVPVVEVPKRLHLAQVSAVRRQFSLYEAMNPELIHAIAAGSECKLLIDDLDSERHSDLAVYLTPPPIKEDRNFWRRWIPELVVELVSPSSRQRDYHEKPEEHLRFGVTEYWIVDADARALVVMRRVRGPWAETIVSPPAIHRTRPLPGLEFSIEAVFTAAGLQ
jgi:Uma2 family endonuclease